MFIKSDIRKVIIALEKTLAHEVYLRLGREGIIHIARLQAADEPADAGIAAEEGRIRAIVTGSGSVLKFLHVETGEESIPEDIGDARRDSEFVSKAKKTMERLQRLRNTIQEALASVAEQLDYAEALREIGIDPGTIKNARLVQTVFGRVTDPLPDLPDSPFVLAGAGGYVFGAALPRAVPEMHQFLKQHGFVDKTCDVGGASLESLKQREAALKRRLDVLERYTDHFRKELGPEIKRLYNSYRGYEEVIKAMRLAAFSAKAMFITGWIDARDKKRLVALLHATCGERFIISDERDPNAPVRMRNIRLFRPFELLVRTMGMPANSELDPTPLAAVTFVLVFGLMFGDLGQGLVLAIAGLILKHTAKKKKREDLGQAGGILFVCGLSAAFCGILYGSLFSSEHIIPALWIHPADNIMVLFAVTILLGAAIILVGLCVNIVNALLNADYQEAFLGKKGMAVLILYCAIVFMVVRYADHRQTPVLWETGVFILLPLTAFSLRGVLGPLLFKGSWPHGKAEYVAETVMEIVEIALSMFANTISFIRVGAFALSHAGLSIVTFTLAGMADPALKSPAAIAILITGNIFIIGFEGLIVGIQSMRLEYYEFFSKFYKGDGVVFSPFVLKTKMSEV